jgi:hypothetical protein
MYIRSARKEDRPCHHAYYHCVRTSIDEFIAGRRGSAQRIHGRLVYNNIYIEVTTLFFSSHTNKLKLTATVQLPIQDAWVQVNQTRVHGGENNGDETQPAARSLVNLNLNFNVPL